MGMEEQSFTIYFCGGPWHGQKHTGALGCNKVAKIGERFTVANTQQGQPVSMLHEYEFAHVQGPMIVAQFVKTTDMPSKTSDAPSWGPWKKK